MSHRQYLLKALELAKIGKGSCAPNPAVGALVVCGDSIISTGFHQKTGQDHAEIIALKQLDYPINNAILYITLEPCNHWGKTPPCVDEIIRSGIKHVVWAYDDPNPEVTNNNSKALLEAAGITCDYFPQAEINEFYRDYAYWLDTGKTFAIMKIAQSLDGKIAKESRERVHLTSSKVNRFTHQQRQHADVILTTSKTINGDNPRLNVRLEDNARSKPVAILDRTLSLTTDYDVFNTASTCLIFHDRAMGVINHYPDNCCLIPTPLDDDHLDMSFVLKKLGELGYHRAWIEVGGNCYTNFMRSGVVNEIYIYVCPVYLGTDTLDAFQSNVSYLFNESEVHWHAIDGTAVGHIRCN